MELNYKGYIFKTRDAKIVTPTSYTVFVHYCSDGSPVYSNYMELMLLPAIVIAAIEAIEARVEGIPKLLSEAESLLESLDYYSLETI